jgi:nicotinamide riboside transporter PnuC
MRFWPNWHAEQDQGKSAVSKTASEIVRDNERIKHVVGVVTTLGTALIIGAIGKWNISGFDAFVLVWLVVALCIIWAGSYSLTMLESEK